MDVVNQNIFLLEGVRPSLRSMTMHNVNHEASVENVRYGVVETKIRVVARIRVVLLKVGKQFYLSNHKITSSRSSELTTTTKSDIASASINAIVSPVFEL